ncbi:MerR family transcriptional regulator [Paucibacter sp. APW11]|uniref:MerR family transcriptional regulator n=1 Tax=Roseateles aquae TaxID=3077235 RepID=A0ABU3PHV7_9BURK|nr:MerR family transcriptional regulator [Paucibacter sp. APW11]MDT9001576.1 MerR family transcriptional regulator [Paucibacter sp. APW11]
MKIGELAARTGLAASAIRFYEASGLLPAASRGPNGYRNYDDAALQRLLAIQLAQRLGFSLDKLRKVMEGQSTVPHDLVMQSLQERLQEIDTMQRELKQQRQDTEALIQHLQNEWPEGRCLYLQAEMPAAPAAKPTRRKRSA